MAFSRRLMSNATSISTPVANAPKWQAQLVAKTNDLRRGAFRDASMGICALVAAADGSIDQDERHQIADLIAAGPVLHSAAPTRYSRSPRRQANRPRRTP